MATGRLAAARGGRHARATAAARCAAAVKGRAARAREVDEVREPVDNAASAMADIIDLSLVAESRKHLQKLLDARGITWFLDLAARRPYSLEPSKVDLVVRAAAKTRKALHGRVHEDAFEYARREVRRELIRRVVAQMLQTGL
jgi:hypothetical protein